MKAVLHGGPADGRLVDVPLNTTTILMPLLPAGSYVRRDASSFDFEPLNPTTQLAADIAKARPLTLDQAADTLHDELQRENDARKKQPDA